jgi:hypothetical protein
MQPDFLNRHDIYLNYFTIGNLIAGIFMVFATAFLLLAKERSRATGHKPFSRDELLARMRTQLEIFSMRFSAAWVL